MVGKERIQVKRVTSYKKSHEIFRDVSKKINPIKS